jgi:hypothetical protein
VQASQPARGRVQAAGDLGGAVGAQDQLRGLRLDLEAELARLEPVRLLEPLAEQDHRPHLIGAGDLRQRHDEAGRQLAPGQQLGQEDIQRVDRPAAGRGGQALAAQPGERRRCPGDHGIAEQRGGRPGIVVLAGIRPRAARAVPVLEVNPQVLDRLGAQLGQHAVAHRRGELRAEAHGGREMVRLRSAAFQRDQRLSPPPHGQIRLELVGRDIERLHRLAARPLPGVLVGELLIGRREQRVEFGAGGVSQLLLAPGRRRGGSRHEGSVMCSGLIGMRGRSRPVAARMAAATAGPEEMAGGSPTPRRPYGACGSGYSRISTRIGGMSRIVGIR